MLAFIPWGYYASRHISNWGRGVLTTFLAVVFLAFSIRDIVDRDWHSMKVSLFVAALFTGLAFGSWTDWRFKLGKTKERASELPPEKIGIATRIAKEYLASSKSLKENEARLLHTEPSPITKDTGDLPQISWRKKQLYVLVGVASWITLIIVWAFLPIHHYAGYYGEYGDWREGYTDLGVGWLASYGLACSLPGLAFGGVFFWWFGKSRDR